MMWVTYKGRVYYSSTSFDAPIGKKRLGREYVVEFGYPTILTWWCNYRERQIVRTIDRWKLGRFVGRNDWKNIGKRRTKRWH